MASTASKRKSAKNQWNMGFLVNYPTLRDLDRSIWCKIEGNIKLSTFFWWNEAVEVIEATEVVEAVEVIEAAEVLDARKITQYVKCKVSFSAKMHKKAKNKIENRFTFGTFKLLLQKNEFEFLDIIL